MPNLNAERSYIYKKLTEYWMRCLNFYYKENSMNGSEIFLKKFFSFPWFPLQPLKLRFLKYCHTTVSRERIELFFPRGNLWTTNKNCLVSSNITFFFVQYYIYMYVKWTEIISFNNTNQLFRFIASNLCEYIISGWSIRHVHHIR